MNFLSKEKIENFAFNIDRPFCADEASAFCGVSRNRTKLFLKELRDEGKIVVQRKVINKYFYIWDKSVQPKELCESKFADPIGKKVSADGYSSLRQIAREAGCSHEQVRQILAATDPDLIDISLRHRQELKDLREVKQRLLKTLRMGKKILREEYLNAFRRTIVPFGER